MERYLEVKSPDPCFFGVLLSTLGDSLDEEVGKSGEMQYYSSFMYGAVLYTYAAFKPGYLV